MSNQANLDFALQGFSRKANVRVARSRNANIITMQDGKEVWLESPEESALFIVHITLLEKCSRELRPNQYINLLKLNSQLDKMQGAWVAIHEETNSLRLCVAIPVESVDAEMIENIVGNIIEFSEEVDIS